MRKSNRASGSRAFSARYWLIIGVEDGSVMGERGGRAVRSDVSGRVCWSASLGVSRAAPLLDLIDLAARPGRIVPGPVLVIEQPPGEVAPALGRQGPLPLRPARHVIGRLLATQPRFPLLMHRVSQGAASRSQWR